MNVILLIGAFIGANHRTIEIIEKYMMRNYAQCGIGNRRSYRRKSAQTQLNQALNRRTTGARAAIDRGHADHYARCACATPSVKMISAQSSCQIPPLLAPLRGRANLTPNTRAGGHLGDRQHTGMVSW